LNIIGTFLIIIRVPRNNKDSIKIIKRNKKKYLLHHKLQKQVKHSTKNIDLI